MIKASNFMDWVVKCFNSHILHITYYLAVGIYIDVAFSLELASSWHECMCVFEISTCKCDLRFITIINLFVRSLGDFVRCGNLFISSCKMIVGAFLVWFVACAKSVSVSFSVAQKANPVPLVFMIFCFIWFPIFEVHHWKSQMFCRLVPSEVSVGFTFDEQTVWDSKRKRLREWEYRWRKRKTKTMKMSKSLRYFLCVCAF